MANLSHWALPVTTAFVLLIFLRLTVNNWSPHVCNTILTEEKSLGKIFRTTISQEDLQIKRNGNSNMEQKNHVLHHSQESRFRAATCQEDLQHINEIENTNVEATSSSQLTEILYKSVTRPVQGETSWKNFCSSNMGQESNMLGIQLKICKKYVVTL